jgi:hypothetical protein
MAGHRGTTGLGCGEWEAGSPMTHATPHPPPRER